MGKMRGPQAVEQLSVFIIRYRAKNCARLRIISVATLGCAKLNIGDNRGTGWIELRACQSADPHSHQGRRNLDGRARRAARMLALGLFRRSDHANQAPRASPRMCAAETPLSPEEWRTFRAALIAGEDGGYPEAGDFRAGSRTPENENQLEQQSEQLFEEYQSGGSWAHPTSNPEPGGLLCAMPLQAILMHRLQFAPPGECRWTEALEALLRAELPAEDAADSADEQRASKSERRALLDRWRASPALTFRLATRMCNEALDQMRRGIAGSRELELWRMQVAALEVRGHVSTTLVQGSGLGLG